MPSFTRRQELLRSWGEWDTRRRDLVTTFRRQVVQPIAESLHGVTDAGSGNWASELEAALVETGAQSSAALAIVEHAARGGRPDVCESVPQLLSAMDSLCSFITDDLLHSVCGLTLLLLGGSDSSSSPIAASAVRAASLLPLGEDSSAVSAAEAVALLLATPLLRFTSLAALVRDLLPVTPAGGGLREATLRAADALAQANARVESELCAAFESLDASSRALLWRGEVDGAPLMVQLIPHVLSSAAGASAARDRFLDISAAFGNEALRPLRSIGTRVTLSLSSEQCDVMAMMKFSAAISAAAAVGAGGEVVLVSPDALRRHVRAEQRAGRMDESTPTVPLTLHVFMGAVVWSVPQVTYPRRRTGVAAAAATALSPGGGSGSGHAQASSPSSANGVTDIYPFSLDPISVFVVARPGPAVRIALVCRPDDNTSAAAVGSSRTSMTFAIQLDIRDLKAEEELRSSGGLDGWLDVETTPPSEWSVLAASPATESLEEARRTGSSNSSSVGGSPPRWRTVLRTMFLPSASPHVMRGSSSPVSPVSSSSTADDTHREWAAALTQMRPLHLVERPTAIAAAGTATSSTPSGVGPSPTRVAAAGAAATASDSSTVSRRSYVDSALDTAALSPLVVPTEETVFRGRGGGGGALGSSPLSPSAASLPVFTTREPSMLAAAAVAAPLLSLPRSRPSSPSGISSNAVAAAAAHASKTLLPPDEEPDAHSIEQQLLSFEQLLQHGSSGTHFIEQQLVHGNTLLYESAEGQSSSAKQQYAGGGGSSRFILPRPLASEISEGEEEEEEESVVHRSVEGDDSDSSSDDNDTDSEHTTAEALREPPPPPPPPLPPQPLDNNISAPSYELRGSGSFFLATPSVGVSAAGDGGSTISGPLPAILPPAATSSAASVSALLSLPSSSSPPPVATAAAVAAASRGSVDLKGPFTQPSYDRSEMGGSGGAPARPHRTPPRSGATSTSVTVDAPPSPPAPQLPAPPPPPYTHNVAEQTSTSAHPAAAGLQTSTSASSSPTRPQLVIAHALAQHSVLTLQSSSEQRVDDPAASELGWPPFALSAKFNFDSRALKDVSKQIQLAGAALCNVSLPAAVCSSDAVRAAAAAVDSSAAAATPSSADFGAAQLQLASISSRGGHSHRDAVSVSMQCATASDEEAALHLLNEAVMAAAALLHATETSTSSSTASLAEPTSTLYSARAAECLYVISGALALSTAVLATYARAGLPSLAESFFERFSLSCDRAAASSRRALVVLPPEEASAAVVLAHARSGNVIGAVEAASRMASKRKWQLQGVEAAASNSTHDMAYGSSGILSPMAAPLAAASPVALDTSVFVALCSAGLTPEAAAFALARPGMWERSSSSSLQPLRGGLHSAAQQQQSCEMLLLRQRRGAILATLVSSVCESEGVDAAAEYFCTFLQHQQKGGSGGSDEVEVSSEDGPLPPFPATSDCVADDDWLTGRAIDVLVEGYAQFRIDARDTALGLPSTSSAGLYSAQDAALELSSALWDATCEQWDALDARSHSSTQQQRSLSHKEQQQQRDAAQGTHDAHSAAVGRDIDTGAAASSSWRSTLAGARFLSALGLWRAAAAAGAASTSAAPAAAAAAAAAGPSPGAVEYSFSSISSSSSSTYHRRSIISSLCARVRSSSCAWRRRRRSSNNNNIAPSTSTTATPSAPSLSASAATVCGVLGVHAITRDVAGAEAALTLLQCAGRVAAAVAAAVHASRSSSTSVMPAPAGSGASHSAVYNCSLSAGASQALSELRLTLGIPVHSLIIVPPSITGTTAGDGADNYYAPSERSSAAAATATALRSLADDLSSVEHFTVTPDVCARLVDVYASAGEVGGNLPLLQSLLRLHQQQSDDSGSDTAGFSTSSSDVLGTPTYLRSTSTCAGWSEACLRALLIASCASGDAEEAGLIQRDIAAAWALSDGGDSKLKLAEGPRADARPRRSVAGLCALRSGLLTSLQTQTQQLEQRSLHTQVELARGLTGSSTQVQLARVDALIQDYAHAASASSSGDSSSSRHEGLNSTPALPLSYWLGTLRMLHVDSSSSSGIAGTIASTTAMTPHDVATIAQVAVENGYFPVPALFNACLGPNFNLTSVAPAVATMTLLREVEIQQRRALATAAASFVATAEGGSSTQNSKLQQVSLALGSLNSASSPPISACPTALQLRTAILALPSCGLRGSSLSRTIAALLQEGNRTGEAIVLLRALDEAAARRIQVEVVDSSHSRSSTGSGGGNFNLNDDGGGAALLSSCLMNPSSLSLRTLLSMHRAVIATEILEGGQSSTSDRAGDAVAAATDAIFAFQDSAAVAACVAREQRTSTSVGGGELLRLRALLGAYTSVFEAAASAARSSSTYACVRGTFARLRQLMRSVNFSPHAQLQLASGYALSLGGVEQLLLGSTWATADGGLESVRALEGITVARPPPTTTSTSSVRGQSLRVTFRTAVLSAAPTSTSPQPFLLRVEDECAAPYNAMIRFFTAATTNSPVSEDEQQQQQQRQQQRYRRDAADIASLNETAASVLGAMVSDGVVPDSRTAIALISAASANGSGPQTIADTLASVAQAQVEVRGVSVSGAVESLTGSLDVVCAGMTAAAAEGRPDIVNALWTRYGEQRAASSASASSRAVTTTSSSAKSNSGDSGDPRLGTGDSPVRIADAATGAFCYSVALAALLSPCATSTSVASSSSSLLSSSPAPHINLLIASPDDVLRTIAAYSPSLLTASTSAVAPAGSSDALANFNFSRDGYSMGGADTVHTAVATGLILHAAGQGAAARALLSLSAQEWAATSTSAAVAAALTPAPMQQLQLAHDFLSLVGGLAMAGLTADLRTLLNRVTAVFAPASAPSIAGVSFQGALAVFSDGRNVLLGGRYAGDHRPAPTSTSVAVGDASPIAALAHVVFDAAYAAALCARNDESGAPAALRRLQLGSSSSGAQLQLGSSARGRALPLLLLPLRAQLAFNIRVAHLASAGRLQETIDAFLGSDDDASSTSTSPTVSASAAAAGVRPFPETLTLLLQSVAQDVGFTGGSLAGLLHQLQPGPGGALIPGAGPALQRGYGRARVRDAGGFLSIVQALVSRAHLWGLHPRPADIAAIVELHASLGAMRLALVDISASPSPLLYAAALRGCVRCASVGLPEVEGLATRMREDGILRAAEQKAQGIEHARAISGNSSSSSSATSAASILGDFGIWRAVDALSARLFVDLRPAFGLQQTTQQLHNTHSISTSSTSSSSSGGSVLGVGEWPCALSMDKIASSPASAIAYVLGRVRSTIALLVLEGVTTRDSSGTMSGSSMSSSLLAIGENTTTAAAAAAAAVSSSVPAVALLSSSPLPPSTRAMLRGILSSHPVHRRVDRSSGSSSGSSSSGESGVRAYRERTAAVLLALQNATAAADAEAGAAAAMRLTPHTTTANSSSGVPMATSYGSVPFPARELQLPQPFPARDAGQLQLQSAPQSRASEPPSQLQPQYDQSPSSVYHVGQPETSSVYNVGQFSSSSAYRLEAPGTPPLSHQQQPLHLPASQVEVASAAGEAHGTGTTGTEGLSSSPLFSRFDRIGPACTASSSSVYSLPQEGLGQQRSFTHYMTSPPAPRPASNFNVQQQQPALSPLPTYSHSPLSAGGAGGNGDGGPALPLAEQLRTLSAEWGVHFNNNSSGGGGAANATAADDASVPRIGNIYTRSGSSSSDGPRHNFNFSVPSVAELLQHKDAWAMLFAPGGVTSTSSSPPQSLLRLANGPTPSTSSGSGGDVYNRLGNLSGPSSLVPSRVPTSEPLSAGDQLLGLLQACAAPPPTFELPSPTPSASLPHHAHALASGLRFSPLCTALEAAVRAAHEETAGAEVELGGVTAQLVSAEAALNTALASEDASLAVALAAAGTTGSEEKAEGRGSSSSSSSGGGARWRSRGGSGGGTTTTEKDARSPVSAYISSLPSSSSSSRAADDDHRSSTASPGLPSSSSSSGVRTALQSSLAALSMGVACATRSLSSLGGGGGSFNSSSSSGAGGAGGTAFTASTFQQQQRSPGGGDATGGSGSSRFISVASAANASRFSSSPALRASSRAVYVGWLAAALREMRTEEAAATHKVRASTGASARYGAYLTAVDSLSSLAGKLRNAISSDEAAAEALDARANRSRASLRAWTSAPLSALVGNHTSPSSVAASLSSSGLSATVRMLRRAGAASIGDAEASADSALAASIAIGRTEARLRTRVQTLRTAIANIEAAFRGAAAAAEADAAAEGASQSALLHLTLHMEAAARDGDAEIAVGEARVVRARAHFNEECVGAVARHYADETAALAAAAARGADAAESEGMAALTAFRASQAERLLAAEAAMRAAGEAKAASSAAAAVDAKLRPTEVRAAAEAQRARARAKRASLTAAIDAESAALQSTRDAIGALDAETAIVGANLHVAAFTVSAYAPAAASAPGYQQRQRRSPQRGGSAGTVAAAAADIPEAVRGWLSLVGQLPLDWTVDVLPQVEAALVDYYDDEGEGVATTAASSSASGRGTSVTPPSSVSLTERFHTGLTGIGHSDTRSSSDSSGGGSTVERFLSGLEDAARGAGAASSRTRERGGDAPASRSSLPHYSSSSGGGGGGSSGNRGRQGVRSSPSRPLSAGAFEAHAALCGVYAEELQRCGVPVPTLVGVGTTSRPTSTSMTTSPPSARPTSTSSAYAELPGARLQQEQLQQQHQLQLQRSADSAESGRNGTAGVNYHHTNSTGSGGAMSSRSRSPPSSKPRFMSPTISSTVHLEGAASSNNSGRGGGTQLGRSIDQEYEAALANGLLAKPRRAL